MTSSVGAYTELCFSRAIHDQLANGLYEVPNDSSWAATTSKASTAPTGHRHPMQMRSELSSRDRPLHWTHHDVALRELYRLKESLQARQAAEAARQAPSTVEVTSEVESCVSELAVCSRCAANTDISFSEFAAAGIPQEQAVHPLFHPELVDRSGATDDFASSTGRSFVCHQASKMAWFRQGPHQHRSRSSQLPSLLVDADPLLLAWCNGCHSDKGNIVDPDLRFRRPLAPPSPQLPCPALRRNPAATPPFHAPLTLGDIRPEEWRQEIIGGVPFPLWSRAQFLHSQGFRGWERVLPTSVPAQQAILNAVNHIRAQTRSLFVTDIHVVAIELQRLSDAGFFDPDEDTSNDGTQLFDKAVANASLALWSCALRPHVPV